MPAQAVFAGETREFVVLCLGCDALRFELAQGGKTRKRVDVVAGDVLLPPAAIKVPASTRARSRQVGSNTETRWTSRA